MYWTEDAINNSLGNSFYQMVILREGRRKVIDANAVVPEPEQELERPDCSHWTEYELAELVQLKGQGCTIEQIADTLGRSERSCVTHWSNRMSWMPRVLSPTRSHVSLARIAEVVCDVFMVGKKDFFGARRAKNVCEARQVFYWLARHYTSHSFPIIGMFTGKDHSTVVHGVQKIEKQMNEFRRRIDLCLFDLKLESAKLSAA